MKEDGASPCKNGISSSLLLFSSLCRCKEEESKSDK